MTAHPNPSEADVPVNEENLLDHEYDGIREFDNPTPGWWTALFVGSCIFSVMYLVFFHMSPTAWTIEEQYELSVSADLKRQFGEIGDLVADEATMLDYMQKEKWLLVGKAVFEGNCASCHASNGSGLIGPNLTDESYKNVKTLTEVATVIAEGAANGAMPSWQNRLHPNEIVLTACYVANMRGKNLPSQRPAEGELIPPWPSAPVPAEGAGE